VSLLITVAAPFKNLRKEQLRRSEFIFFLAIDRKWVNKEQANRLIACAERDGLIRLDNGVITPLFNPAEISIPLGYKPTTDILDEKDPVSDLLGRIAQARDLGDSVVAAEMNAVIEDRFDGHLLPEAAVVLLAKQYAVPFEDLLEDLKKNVERKK
jgi:hypothetical protein